MRVKGLMKNYYREKVGKHPPPPRIPGHIITTAGPPLSRTVLQEAVLFHALLLLSLGFALLWNREPPRSFRGLDPENRNIVILEEKLRKGVDDLKAFLQRPPSFPNQGGKK